MASGYFPTFENGKYCDNLKEYTKNIFSHGVICGCSGKIYNKRNSFPAHLKSKKHINWIKCLNHELFEQKNQDEKPKSSKIIHSCIICCDPLDNTALSLPCAHTFHEKCITDWLKIKSECPICKHHV